MAHVLDDKSPTEDKNMEVDDTSDARFAAILHSRAMVSPNDHEFELITERMASLMEEGRGECIFEVGLGSGK